jgi:hypothetical protein
MVFMARLLAVGFVVSFEPVFVRWREHAAKAERALWDFAHGKKCGENGRTRSVASGTCRRPTPSPGNIVARF